MTALDMLEGTFSGCKKKYNNNKSSFMKVYDQNLIFYLRFLMEDILTCNSRKTTVAMNDINDGLGPWACAC